MSEYFDKHLFEYYVSYAKEHGVTKKQARASKQLLQHEFERADQSQQIERVFDRVLAKIARSAAAASQAAPPAMPPPPVVYATLRASGETFEELRERMGWASAEKVRAEGILQATEIKPSDDLIDWLEGAFSRYFAELAKVNCESINKGRKAKTHRDEESFYDKFLHAGEMWSGEGQEKPVVAPLEEAMRVCPCHATEPTNRYVEKVYDPSTEFAVDLHMRTSFTNRLRGIDWDYFMQRVD